MENEQNFEKNVLEALNKADDYEANEKEIKDEEEQKKEDEEEKKLAKDKPDGEVAKHGTAIFRWYNSEHRRHLSACLATFPPELVNLVGSLVPDLEWSQTQKSADIVLSVDDSGLQRVARRNPEFNYRSVLSALPLSPSSSSIFSFSAASSSPPSSRASCSLAKRFSVAAFEVRVDRKFTGIYIGVSGVLPTDSYGVVGGKGYGVGYCCDGGVLINNQWARRDSDGQQIYLATYGTGDVIGVEVDFSAKLQAVAFFKNGELQGRPFDVSDLSTSGIDFARPLYAAVCMHGSEEQVTLL